MWRSVVILKWLRHPGESSLYSGPKFSVAQSPACTVIADGGDEREWPEGAAAGLGSLLGRLAGEPLWGASRWSTSTRARRQGMARG